MLSESDQERFMRLWTSAQPAVANYLHAIVHDHGAAKEVLQETALVLLRRFTEYDGQRPFLAWALGIARFQVMGLQRDAARSRVAFDDELLAQFTDTWAELAPASSDRSAALQSCIERLAAHARRLVQLRYFEDLSAEQIAQRLGGNGPTVRVIRSKALRSLSSTWTFSMTSADPITPRPRPTSRANAPRSPQKQFPNRTDKLTPTP